MKLSGRAQKSACPAGVRFGACVFLRVACPTSNYQAIEVSRQNGAATASSAATPACRLRMRSRLMQDRRASGPNGWHDNGPNWDRRAPKRSSASRSSAVLDRAVGLERSQAACGRSSGDRATFLSAGLARDAAGCALGEVRKLLAHVLAGDADGAHRLGEGGAELTAARDCRAPQAAILTSFMASMPRQWLRRTHARTAGTQSKGLGSRPKCYGRANDGDECAVAMDILLGSASCLESNRSDAAIPAGRSRLFRGIWKG